MPGPVAGGRSGRGRNGRAAAAGVVVVLSATFCPVTVPSATAATAGTAAVAAGAVPLVTESYYERSANARMAYLQGKAAGKQKADGIVILDFGRPADDKGALGTMSYGGRFVPFAAITKAVQSYVQAYYLSAPRFMSLDIAVGTNDSCGTSQPCGTTPACGCPDEPASFYLWGRELAVTVIGLGAWSSSLRARNGFTDDVRVVAADDAEPAYDPGYTNTYDLLAGYAAGVGGTFPAMVDYGSADASFWTESQLLQVAYGFAPDVPMPQVYFKSQAAQWASLLRYAKAHRRAGARIFGVLTTGDGTNDPATAYEDMERAATGVTSEWIPWLSTIRR